MNEVAIKEPGSDAVEEMLRAELAQDDKVIANGRSMLRGLVAHADHALFSDEVIARTRGMLLHVARQLLEAQAEAAAIVDRPGFAAAHEHAMGAPLLEDAAFLAHAHSLALEAGVAERLRARAGVDPVLTPLVQEIVASADGTRAGGAMAGLAAQARFIQHQRRMELPLRDLPADLFHTALLVLREHASAHAHAAQAAERTLRDGYQEGDGREALLSRLVTALGDGAARALVLDRAGVSIFVTALAIATGQDRERVVLSLAGRQFTRLALSLRAAGLTPEAAEVQFTMLHPEAALPEGLRDLSIGAAAALLATPLTESSL